MHGSEVLRFLMFRLDFNSYYANAAAAAAAAERDASGIPSTIGPASLSSLSLS